MGAVGFIDWVRRPGLFAHLRLSKLQIFLTVSTFFAQKDPLMSPADANRSALAAYIRAGIDGPRKSRRVFQNRLQECFPCRTLIAAQRKQTRLIERFARENDWSVMIHDMGVSVTFQRLASEGQAASEQLLAVNYRSRRVEQSRSPQIEPSLPASQQSELQSASAAVRSSHETPLVDARQSLSTAALGCAP